MITTILSVIIFIPLFMVFSYFFLLDKNIKKTLLSSLLAVTIFISITFVPSLLFLFK
ncbi:hypothetical protein Xmau_00670 [Xenorhabdus mauleonii]|uniref:Uncharacterized protein n=1 Tax=Xenorhabdus mauleonii TaxID=351675 RepID=A0A1I3JN41_9GAMM|nr:hypothetical protein Xmau_00670 [Xenorhabdus mauleonii]SFI61687.1 hypothetical protein SAMN05421680_102264 [Xenorhabdus mauleonii]